MNSLTCSDKKIGFYPKKSIVWSLSRLDDLGLIKEKIHPGETVTQSKLHWAMRGQSCITGKSL